MINTSESYKAAITGDSRRMLLKAVIDITDPDIVFGTGQASSQAAFSKPEQLHDRVFDLEHYITLERNRWLLNGSFQTIPAAGAPGEIGMVGGELSGEDGTFTTKQWAELHFSNVSILQACSVYFPKANHDGFPVDFTVEIKQGGTVYHTQAFKGNTADSVSLSGFTVYDPDAIRVTATRWSLPGRRMRMVEILPGVYEEWDETIIASFSVAQQANFSCLALPYGTCTLKMDNLDRRFEPRSKNGVFQSIEERQGIDVSIGVRTEAGDEFVHVGKFYQYSGGWRTGDNGLTMQWNLVDIVGLLAEREFIPPSTIPTTLEGWAAALVAQLGANFEGLYTVDPDYADLAVTASLDQVKGKKCGELMRFACMATGTWPRADAQTGRLTFEPFWNQGNKLTLDNLTAYPVMKANNDLAAIIFTLNDGSDTQCIISGNSTASSSTVSVNNPFIQTEAQALTAARMILSTYGGNKLETMGRGDPSSEIGDVDTVWLDESSATTGRRLSQTLQFQNGVLQNCKSVLLQADGSFLFEERVILTESGSWTAPAGKGTLRIIVVGCGGDGGDGTDGSWSSSGVDGADGLGAPVWAGTININEGQTFDVSISDTGTTFGDYSSQNGNRYAYGYTDVASGDVFARTGVGSPVKGSGDGGIRGFGGAKGNRSWDAKDGWEIHNYPGKGKPGTPGATGCVVIYWDKED